MANKKARDNSERGDPRGHAATGRADDATLTAVRECEKTPRSDESSLTRTRKSDEHPHVSPRENADSALLPNAPGQRIGRYLVISQIGAGGMGIVLAAYDPNLDRKVALKLLKTPSTTFREANSRLLREGRALAKLDHQNIVKVHDVGLHNNQLFVAMEFVDGQTALNWISAVEVPRPWPEVLAVFMAAGRGLAEAHAEGIVHRDFKPENVMIGVDGRVRVMDFGIALAEAPGDPAELELAAETHTDLRASSHRLTVAGTIIGTPAYMSPEQLRGAEVDVRSDQFSYCVTLYEALYGERPFAGQTLRGLQKSVEEGMILKQPSSVRVPAWLRSALLRGLAPLPEERWPSMQALLEALSHDPARRRRRWLQAAGIVALLGVGGAAALTVVPTPAHTCEGMERHLAGVWDHDRRSDVKNAIVSTGLPYAPDTWERVQFQLDSYTAAWVVAREDACVATRQGEQSAHLLDLRIACLDQRLVHARAVVDELARTDKSSVELAVKMVAKLPTLERCSRTDLLTAKQPPPEDPEVAARVATLDRELIRARTKEHAGHFDEGLALTEAVLADGVPLDYEPLLARAWLLRGKLRGHRGEFALAQADLERALEAALALDMKEVSAQAAIDLMFYVGYKQARLEEGTRWSALARALTRASRDNTRQIHYLTAAGDLAYSHGKFDEARDLWTEALELFDRTDSSGSTEALNRSKVLSNLGIVARKLGHNAEAREYHTQALAIAERLLGPAHPAIADILNDMGSLAKTEGNIAAANEYWERALTLAERSLGPEHPSLAATLANLGNLATKEGEHAKAHAYLGRALAIDQKALGPEHPEVAGDLTSLGLLAVSEGEHAKAKTLYLQALTIRERELGPDNPGVIYPLANLGVLMELMGDDEGALRHFRRALAIAEETLGADHALVAGLLTSIGISLIGVGDPTAAVDELERALQIRVNLNENNGGVELDLALTRSELARALWLAKKPDRARAHSLAELALSAYTATGKSNSTNSKRVQVWLEKHTLSDLHDHKPSLREAPMIRP